jgi:hypothetical protein
VILNRFVNATDGNVNDGDESKMYISVPRMKCDNAATITTTTKIHPVINTNPHPVINQDALSKADESAFSISVVRVRYPIDQLHYINDIHHHSSTLNHPSTISEWHTRCGNKITCSVLVGRWEKDGKGERSPSDNEADRRFDT